MRKWLISILAVLFLLVCVGCQDSNSSIVTSNSITIVWKGDLTVAPSNPEPGWAYYNSTEDKTYIWDGSVWRIIAKNGEAGTSSSPSSGNQLYSATYIGESTETISGVTYKVKSYAYGTGPIPYFYDYYKYYYLNDKLRRLEVFNHREGSNLDYLCTEFVEHLCGNRTKTNMIYGYYESGKLESIIYDTKSPDGNTKSEYHYSEDGVKLSYSYYFNDKIKYEYTYYPNGIVKSLKDYSGERVYEDKYYESGNRKTRVYYYEDGMMYSREEYDDSKLQYAKRRIFYYPDGMIESEAEYYNSYYTKKGISYYSDGTIKSEYENYDNSYQFKKHIEYYPNGTIMKECEFYATGQIKKIIEYDSEGNPTAEEYIVHNLYVKYKTDESMKTDGTIAYMYYKYPSGYSQYYYDGDGGYLYTYEDKKTTGYPISSYSSKTAYTDEEAKVLIESLRPAD